MDQFTVKFMPQGLSIRIPEGTDLLTAAIKCGIVLNAVCGGERLCGKCRVRIVKGSVKAGGASRFISDDDRKNGFVLACDALVDGDVEVEVPKESIGIHGSVPGGAEEFTKGIVLESEKRFPFSPLVYKTYLELKGTADNDDASALEGLCGSLRTISDDVNISVAPDIANGLGDLLQKNAFKVTVALGRKDACLEILAIEPGDTTSRVYGLAFDIGTTTVAGQLIDMNSGKIAGTRIAFNKQAGYGSDIITRIIYASSQDGLTKLNIAVLENMEEMIKGLCASAGVKPHEIYGASCAGNMTMMHLLLKIDPSGIRKEPYMPERTVFPSMRASDIGLGINPGGTVSFLPGVSTYIGGDIVAGVLACALADGTDLALLADIGTNGEIVLGNKEWMIGAAASAGPAFEGSGLQCGMKAVSGAIDKITITKALDVKASTIGGLAAKGICGSGYIDLLCQMLKSGIIGKDGKIDRSLKSPRIRKGENNFEFVVTFKDKTATGKDVVIDEDDIENLKRSKAAIYSAIITLVKKVEKTISSVKRIYIAGGFGNYLNIENAIFIGLLPDAERGVYEFIGNSSLAGARMALNSAGAVKRADEIYKNITYLDLGSEHDYMNEYVAALFFPHTDAGRFPSVRL